MILPLFPLCFQSQLRHAAGLLVSLLLCLAAAAIGGLATQRAPEFYAALSRPSWAPPASVFGPVWTVLNGLMAFSAWFIWKERGFRNARVPLVLFAAQLFLNALWSWLFFSWRRGLAAEVEILLLLGFIAATLVAFWRIRPLAGALLLPYLVWVAYASALTLAIVRRNPGAF